MKIDNVAYIITVTVLDTEEQYGFRDEADLCEFIMLMQELPKTIVKDMSLIVIEEFRDGSCREI